MLPPRPAVLSRVHVSRSDTVVSDASVALLQYWRKLGGEDGTPSFSSFQLMDIYKVAPQLYIRDWVEDGNEFRVRFIGTKLTEWLGKELTGKLVCESFTAEAATSLLEAFRICASENCPVRTVGYADFVERREHWNFESLYLPLLGPDGTVDHVVGAADYQYKLRDDDLPNT